MTARSGPAGAAAQAARRSRRPRSGLPPPQLGWVGGQLVKRVKLALELEAPITAEKNRRRNQAKGVG